MVCVCVRVCDLSLEVASGDLEVKIKESTKKEGPGTSALNLASLRKYVVLCESIYTISDLAEHR